MFITCSLCTLKVRKAIKQWAKMDGCTYQALHDQIIWDSEEQIVSSPSVKSLLIHLAIVGRKQQSWPRGWGSIMETMTAAAVVVTAESPRTAEGQQEADEPRPRKRCVGGPMLLWRAPGNIGHMINLRSADRCLFIDHTRIKNHCFKFPSCK